MTFSYGESHYIGPLSSPHTDDGGSKWVNDMYQFITQSYIPLIDMPISRPHGGWLEMAKPFIQAYKSARSARFEHGAQGR